MWAGKFSRWKRREVSAQQPGLLKYRGRERRGKAKAGSINLHGAAVEVSASDSRLLVIRSPDLGKVYLRTTDPADRQACLESIQRSISTFGTMLSRASAVFGGVKQEGGLPGGLQPSSSNRAAGEPMVARELHDRMRNRLKAMQPQREAFENQLAGLRAQLEGVAASLNLGPPVRSSAFSVAHAALQQLESNGKQHSRGRQADGPQLFHADSFESALSELQRSPSWHEEASPEEPGSFCPLNKSWQAYNDAVEAGARSDAIRIIELQAENEALKAAMRNFKKRAVAMRPTAARPSISTSFERRYSSGSEDSTGNTPHRQASDDIAFGCVRDDEKVAGMPAAMTEEYRMALEALEAIQRHAFEVSAHRIEASIAADEAIPPPPPADEPSPDAEGDLEEAVSDEDSRSERGSRRGCSLQLETGNPWEVASRRKRLPAPAPLQRGFSIWSVLKNALGKDLTRITLPATINEPLSALQRIVEDLEYRHLLDSAAASRDPTERMLLVAAFVASGYSATLARESKPFNPLLGETFEWQSADTSCRFVCEQVSHHPPISCWWANSTAGWTYWGEVELRSKFWGKSVEMMPTGTCWLQLGDELWSWNKANMTINNIIMGTIWLEWHGKITLCNHATGTTASLVFPKSNGHLAERGVVQCAVKDRNGAAFHLAGKYTNRLFIQQPCGSEQEVFRINLPPEQGSLQYNLTSLAMTLNTAEPELMKQLPPTDSRLRPDQRSLEDGDLERATPEKMRLEEKQRESRKHRKEAGESIFPVWFKLQRLSEKQRDGADHWLGSQLVRLPGQSPPSLWQFTGEYWDCKQRLDWARCPDIYSDSQE